MLPCVATTPPIFGGNIGSEKLIFIITSRDSSGISTILLPINASTPPLRLIGDGRFIQSPLTALEEIWIESPDTPLIAATNFIRFANPTTASAFTLGDSATEDILLIIFVTVPFIPPPAKIWFPAGAANTNVYVVFATCNVSAGIAAVTEKIN